MAFTTLENCEVFRTDGTPPYISMEPRPVYDEKKYGGYMEPLHIAEDGTTIVWMDNGEVCRSTPDGTLTFWYPRITIKDALLFPAKGLFVKFNSDGSTVCVRNSVPWYWGLKNVSCDMYEIHQDNFDYEKDCGCKLDPTCCGNYKWEPYSN